jgi:general secretion pathway protein F
MPLFQYKAVSSAGEIQEGVLDSPSQSGVMEHLKSLGLIPIRAAEVASANAAVTSSSKPEKKSSSLFGAKKVSQVELAHTTRELATLLRAGLPLDRSLEILINLAERDRVRELLQSIRNEVRGGAALSKALEQHRDVFSRFYINMVKAGEAGGALGVVLQRLSDHMERSKELRDSVVSSMIYPVILMIVSCIVVIVLIAFVIPQFKQIFAQSGKALPALTSAVISTGLFLRASWPPLLAVVAAIILFTRRSWINPVSRANWDRRLLGWPAIGSVIARVEMARFARSLSTLLQSGVPLLTCMSILKETLGNAVFREAVDLVSRELKEGRGMAKPMMETGVFPKLAVQMIAVGEETGRLDEMLLQVADVYDREVARALKQALAAFQPLLIIGLAIVIGLLIFSILSPMFDMMDLPL